MTAPDGSDDSAGQQAYSRFWSGVGRTFPDLGGAPSTTFYRANEERLFREHLQRLKGEKCDACKKCQGDKSGDEIGNKDDADWSPFTNPATGRRKENKDAKTASEDERIRGIFGPRGKKTYGGATKGPAFKKATTAELGPAIQQAAQDAPKATDSQRLPRDAKDTVKEYFQNLGGQGPGGK